jgi:hypothetical protein
MTLQRETAGCYELLHLPCSADTALDRLKSPLARDLIAKQKRGQAEQERARRDEKHHPRYINHVEIPHAQTLSSSMAMARELMVR